MKTAHSHLLSVLRAELGYSLAASATRPIRILDVGCGFGQLMVDLLGEASAAGSDLEGLEAYGFEVFDHRAATPGYLPKAIARLRSAEPLVDWKDRVRLGAADEPWPFEDGFFDFAVSNQVLEHVADIGWFFSELGRVVKHGGGAAHFFPSAKILLEPHCGLPGVHWLPRAFRRTGLLVGSRCGLGKLRRYRREQGRGLQAFCDEFDAYLERYVFFRSNRRILSHASRASSRAGFKYTQALLKRAALDDWEPFAYAYQPHFSSRAWLAPFVCSTLVQRF